MTSSTLIGTDDLAAGERFEFWREALSRAFVFKATYGLTPGEYRRSSLPAAGPSTRRR